MEDQRKAINRGAVPCFLNNPIKYTDPSGWNNSPFSPTYADIQQNTAQASAWFGFDVSGTTDFRNTSNLELGSWYRDSDGDYLQYVGDGNGQWGMNNEFDNVTVFLNSTNVSNSAPYWMLFRQAQIDFGFNPIKGGGYQNSGGSRFNDAKRMVKVIGVTAKLAENFAGKSRIGSNGKLYRTTSNGNVFKGNQYVKTTSVSKVAGGIAKKAGAVGHVLTVGEVGYTIYQEGEFGQKSQLATSRAAGGIAGGWAGAKIGAAVGGSIGAAFGGVGAAPGALIGGIVGSWTGSEIGGHAYEAL